MGNFHPSVSRVKNQCREKIEREVKVVKIHETECATYSYLNVSWRTRGVLAFPTMMEKLSRKHNISTVSKTFSLGGQCL